MLIVHRDYQGEHVESGANCWCHPIIVEDDDQRTSEEIAEESKKPIPRPN